MRRKRLPQLWPGASLIRSRPIARGEPQRLDLHMAQDLLPERGRLPECPIVGDPRSGEEQRSLRSRNGLVEQLALFALCAQPQIGGQILVERPALSISQKRIFAQRGREFSLRQAEQSHRLKGQPPSLRYRSHEYPAFTLGQRLGIGRSFHSAKQVVHELSGGLRREVQRLFGPHEPAQHVLECVQRGDVAARDTRLFPCEPRVRGGTWHRGAPGNPQAHNTAATSTLRRGIVIRQFVGNVGSRQQPLGITDKFLQPAHILLAPQRLMIGRAWWCDKRDKAFKSTLQLLRCIAAGQSRGQIHRFAILGGALWIDGDESCKRFLPLIASRHHVAPARGPLQAVCVLRFDPAGSPVKIGVSPDINGAAPRKGTAGLPIDRKDQAQQIDQGGDCGVLPQRGTARPGQRQAIL